MSRERKSGHPCLDCCLLHYPALYGWMDGEIDKIAEQNIINSSVEIKSELSVYKDSDQLCDLFLHI